MCDRQEFDIIYLDSLTFAPRLQAFNYFIGDQISSVDFNGSNRWFIIIIIITSIRHVLAIDVINIYNIIISDH